MAVYKDNNHFLYSLEGHVYKGVYESSKVRYLNNGIKKIKFNYYKAPILSSEYYCSNFDGAVNLYKYFIQNLGGKLYLKVADADSEKLGDGGSASGGTNKLSYKYQSKDFHKKWYNEKSLSSGI